MRLRERLGLVVGLVVLSQMVFGKGVEAGGVIKIIPFGFGQNQKQAEWFRYQFEPGSRGKIEIEVINLGDQELKGRIEIEGDGLEELVEAEKVQILPRSRQRVSLGVQVPINWQKREYESYILVKDKEKGVVGKEKIRVQIGKGLKFDYQINEFKVKTVNDGLLLKFGVINEGQVRVRRLQVKVRYKNDWWMGIANEEAFGVDLDLGVGQKGRVERKIDLPYGVMGPVWVKAMIEGGGKQISREVKFFWVGWRRLLVGVGWSLIVLLGIGVAFRLIFKGMAGIIYKYLKRKAKKERQKKKKEEELVDLLKIDSYPQLLLDIRRIIREEMEVNRRLMMAEIEKSVAIKMLTDENRKTVKGTKGQRRRRE